MCALEKQLMLPVVSSRSRRYLWLQWTDFAISHATSISCAKHRALFTQFCQTLKAAANHQNRFFFFFISRAPEGVLYKQAPLVVLQERTNGQAEWGWRWRRDITGSSRRELQHLGTERHLTAEGTIPLVEWRGKGIDLTESCGAGGVHARTAADSAGTVVGDQVSWMVHRRER